MRRCVFLACAVVLLGLTIPAFPQSVPSPEAFLGYAIGREFTPHHRILEYFQALAAATNRVKIESIGETWEGRPLILAVITSPENHAAMESIRSRVISLSRPDTTTAANAEQIAASTPVVVWLGFGVHGDESSSSEASMMVAHRLLTDESSATLLENCVVLIDPLQNPDGRQRYLEWYVHNRGVEPDPNHDALEHYQPWPGGRFNHYLVDMNRDWAWLSQKETMGRITAFQRWRPQVLVDFHEMSYASTYFFPPDANPLNANISKETARWLEIFGRSNASAFSEYGWPFFVSEVYDLFYPGYGDSWPALQGTIGMTYEMAGGGRAGTIVRREDETVLTLADRAQKHFTTGMATVRTASERRRELLLHAFQTTRDAWDQARHTYLVLPTSPNVVPAMRMLHDQGIRISVLSTPSRLKAKSYDDDRDVTQEFPAGTFVVTTKQPLASLVQSLFEKTPAFSPSFLDEQRQKIEADEEADFYDITAWSVPISHNLETFVLTAPLAAAVEPWTTPAEPQPFAAGRFGYLIDALDPALYRAMGALFRANVKFSVADFPISAGSRSLARGTLVIQKSNNAANLDQTLQRIAREEKAGIIPAESAWLGDVALGSNRVRFVKNPRIGLFGGQGTDSTSYGAIWYLFDIETKIPYSALTLSRLASIDLSKYSVLVLPDGSGYREAVGKKGIERLQNWVRSGGTLIAVKGAGDFLRDKEVEISKVKLWTPPKKKDGDTEQAEQRYNDFPIPGAAFRTTMNSRSYLTYGVPRGPKVLIEGSKFLLPVPYKVDNIVTIAEKDPLISGFAWPEALERVKGSVFVVKESFGDGTVITFAEDPFYRLFWRGTLPLFMNAAVYSPSME